MLAEAEAAADAEAEAAAEARAEAAAAACAAASSFACTRRRPARADEVDAELLIELVDESADGAQSRVKLRIQPGIPPEAAPRFALSEPIIADSECAALAFSDAIPIAFMLAATDAISESFAEAEADSAALAGMLAAVLADALALAFNYAEAEAKAFAAAFSCGIGGNAGGNFPCNPAKLCEQIHGKTAPSRQSQFKSWLRESNRTPDEHLVLLHSRLDLFGPSVNAAGHALRFFKAVLTEPLRTVHAPAAVVAMDDDRLILVRLHLSTRDGSTLSGTSFVDPMCTRSYSSCSRQSRKKNCSPASSLAFTLLQLISHGRSASVLMAVRSASIGFNLFRFQTRPHCNPASRKSPARTTTAAIPWRPNSRP